MDSGQQAVIAQGVREAMMVVLLSPLTGGAVATGLAVSMRLTTLLGDGLTVLVGVLSSSGLVVA